MWRWFYKLAFTVEPAQPVLCDNTLTYQENWCLGISVNIRMSEYERMTKHIDASNSTSSLEMFKTLIKWARFYYNKGKFQEIYYHKETLYEI